MNTNATLRVINGVLMYDVTTEKELRYEMKTEDFKKAIVDGVVKIYDTIKIEQVWFGSSDKYTARIRKTTNAFGEKLGDEKYEHTVKHHIQKKIDYEVTTDLTKQDYELLQKLYSKEKYQSKLRVYVKDVSGAYNNYVVTVDIPDDNPDMCFVEFELKDANCKEAFKKPHWVKVYEK